MSLEPTAGRPPGASPQDPLEPFLREGREVVRALGAAVAALGGGDAAAAAASLQVLTHRLRGSAAQYGLPEIASLAGAMEGAVTQFTRGSEEARARSRASLAEAVTLLAASLEAARGEAPDAGRAGEPAAPAPAATAPAEDPLGARLRAFGRESADVLEFFGAEAREQTEGLAAAVAELAKEEPGSAAIDTAFRLAHTLKGAAYMVGCRPMGDLAHAMEDLLGPAREGRLGVRGPVLRALEDAVDVLQRMLAALHGSAVAVEAPCRDVEARLGWLARGTGPQALAEPQAAPAVPPAAGPAAPGDAGAAREGSIRVGLERIDEVMSLVGEAVVSRGRLDLHRERLGAIERLFAVSRNRMARVVEELEQGQLKPALSREESAEPAAAAAPAGAVLDLADFSELELDRYDALDLLARQIAEISYDLGETQNELAVLDRTLGAELKRTGKLLKQLRAAVGRTRMLPLTRLFQRFRRRVERFARDQGRPVRLEIQGEQVEVDTAIAERIAEPLLHLVNNALGHGLEPVAERRAAGKPEEATLALRAHLHGVFVDLEVEDDGRGLWADELRRRAVALGLRSAAEVERLSDAEAQELIFLPGFSTAPQVTEAAGRGMGLDVVRAVVAELNGQIQTETVPGQGTRFTLRLPVTLVVSTALGVRAGGETFALPTLNVRRLLRLAEATVERRDGREWIALDGEPVEVIRLARELGLEEDAARDSRQLVVVQVLGREVALQVDELLGIEEVVVQGLGDFLAGLPGFGGVTVAADGRVVLILDPAGLPTLAPAGGRLRAPAPARRERRHEDRASTVLLADDSVSVRRILGRQLSAAGYEVVAVQDGEQALEALRERSFAALITDIEMPRLNGFELLDLVRRRPANRGMPTIVITTRAGRKHREQAARLGAVAYFSKPIDLEALLATLGAVTATPAGIFTGGGAGRGAR